MCSQGYLLYPELSYAIVGCLYKAHNALGRYKNEKQYGDFLEQIFSDEKIAYMREIEDTIILELKVKPLITREDYFQVQRYLVASNKRLGILVNFRYASIKPRRILHPPNEVNTKHS
jgi:hypothetical protein